LSQANKGSISIAQLTESIQNTVEFLSATTSQSSFCHQKLHSTALLPSQTSRLLARPIHSLEKPQLSLDGVAFLTVLLQDQPVQNNVITNEDCARFTSNVFDVILCTSTAGGRGPCQGDSGGPLTIQSGGRRVVVSFGPGELGCESGTFAGFSRVTSFLQWIANNQNP
jgi:secreted trypsin-like serine protease